MSTRVMRTSGAYPVTETVPDYLVRGHCSAPDIQETKKQDEKMEGVRPYSQLLPAERDDHKPHNQHNNQRGENFRK